MAKKKHEDTVNLGRGEEPPELPPGVKLVRTLREHTDWIGRIAWSPDVRKCVNSCAAGMRLHI